jgi:hypothetical protein
LSAVVIVTVGPTFFPMTVSGTPTAKPPFLDTSRVVLTLGKGLGEAVAVRDAGSGLASGSGPFTAWYP